MASAVGIGAATFGSTAVASDGRYDYGFDTVINMVKVGADPTGEEPVTPLIHEHADDNTLLYFPEGRYKLTQYRNYPTDVDEFDSALYTRYENFGFRGDGSGKSVFVAPEGLGSEGGYFDRLWFEVRYGRNILIEGFTLDVTAERTGGRFQLVPSGGFVMRDVRVKGVFDNPHGPLLFWVLEPDEYGLVQNVRAPDGAESPTETFTTNGMFVSPLTRGTITFRDCHVEGFTDNGLYASNPIDPAAIQVEGGYYANNNISQVRLGTSKSYVRNARVEVTEDVDTWYTTNMRGIRQADGSGVTVDNCDVVMSADVGSSGGIVSNQTSGELHVKNTRIRTDAPFESPAIFVKSNEGNNYSGGIHAQNVSITGDADGWSAVDVVDRSNSSFKNVCIKQTGNGRDGITLTRSSATISESTIDVAGETIVEEEGEAETRNLREGGRGGCQSPRL
ncbi:hypothetical protein [Halosolutus gelatinilyticus]|uniref:hypothetical protein n=1 Tax=Halosolutus gelatinilyticus TaxID=2931975 RepID=UPI001FF1B4B8|nr:hypothetical protein [Halosolutus gelatinilyticus]